MFKQRNPRAFIKAKQIKTNIDNSSHQDSIRRMRTERNKILIHCTVKIAEEKEENIRNKMKIIEQQKSEPTRMYETNNN